MQYFTETDSPVGPLILRADDTGLTGLCLKTHANISDEMKEEETPVLRKAKAWLSAYFAGESAEADFELHFSGTPFQKTVWSLIGEVPYGKTITYKELADRTAKKLGRESMSAQAIGQACSKNPIWLIIPCHRIIRSDRTPGGYEGGTECKCALLKMERENTSNQVNK